MLLETAKSENCLKVLFHGGKQAFLKTAPQNPRGLLAAGNSGPLA